MFRSIRWRLPLSYAAIALLAALSLGAVLLAVLRGYYARQEAGYLLGNAKAVGAVMTEMLQDGQPAEALQAQIEVYALLSQSQVQVWDAQGQLLARAGAPGKTQVVSVVKKLVDPSSAMIMPGRGARVVVRATGAQPSDATDQVLAELRRQITSQPTLYITLGQSSTGAAPAAPGEGTDTALPAPAGVPMDLPPDFVSSISVVGTRLGIGFDPAAAWNAQRSSQTVRRPITGQDGQLLGYVQLSDGPAYGRDIVESVARGWAVASSVAVLLAAVAGWLISRSVSKPVLALTAVTTRMANGDLAARATVTGGDELGQLAGSFNRMAGRVEGTISTLRRFVADATHELHTPLTALRTDLELAATETDAAARAELIVCAQGQVARLEALTTSLLDLSRLEAGARQGECEPMDLVALVRQACEPFASRAEQAGLGFRLDLPPRPVTVRGDPAQLARALGNLLDNACKFTPEGGEIAVALRCGRAWAELSVEDTGIGIPADDLSHLFGRFHRARNVADYPGSGLGLAIVKAIAEAHGAEVRAESAGRGARFVLRLPLRES